METPTIVNFAEDPARRIRVEFLAYREMSDAEIAQELAKYVAASGGTLKAGHTYRVVTSIGARDVV